MYVTSMFPTTVSNSLQPKEVQELQQLIVDHHAYKSKCAFHKQRIRNNLVIILDQVMIMNTKLENLVKIIEEANKQTQSKHQQEIDQVTEAFFSCVNTKILSNVSLLYI